MLFRNAQDLQVNVEKQKVEIEKIKKENELTLKEKSREVDMCKAFIKKVWWFN